MSEYLNLLSIRFRPKGVPYGGTEPRDDGDKNYGFMDLKGGKCTVDDVPELSADTHLKLLVAAINARDTGLFSLGCVSGPVDSKEGHRFSGYVEIALNSASQVTDAANYFPLFFHFEKSLHGAGFALPVKFDWQLEPARFTEARVSGFTCAIFINTAFQGTSEEAASTWSNTLAMLGEYLGSVACWPGKALY